jgi:AraC-like DNA-binding protein
MIIHIKNMVCPRCKSAVQAIFEKSKIPFSTIELGHVEISQPITVDQKRELTIQLKEIGFELLETESSVLVKQIKSLIIQQIHYNKNELTINYSDYLSDETKQSYNYLSRLFSDHEGITVERYITKQKIERIKKMIFNDEKSLVDIAFEMNYSSSAYLSTQFKKETGITPSEFKRIKDYKFQNLDDI